MGQLLISKSEWGNKFIDNLAQDIKTEFPETTGFSEDDLKQEALYAACLLATRKDTVTKEEQFELINMLDLRYICVDLNVQNEKILRTLLRKVRLL